MTRIQLCGRLSVQIDGVQLAERLRGRQVPLLLAYLVLNRERHIGRDELIGALWPSQPPVSQDAALRTLLSRLRSSLGSDTLTGRDELILALPEPVWIDVEAAASEVARALDWLERGDARRAWALAQVPLNIASRGLLPGAQAFWLRGWGGGTSYAIVRGVAPGKSTLVAGVSGGSAARTSSRRRGKRIPDACRISGRRSPKGS